MSSKVIDFGDNRMPICNFLLVVNSNFGRISYRFRELSHKARKQLVFPPIPLFDDSQNFWMKLIPQKLEGWGTANMRKAGPDNPGGGN